MANEVEIVVTSSRRGDAMKTMRGDMDRTGRRAGAFGDTLKGVGKIAGGMLAAAGIAAGFSKLTGFLGDSIGLAKEQAAVEAQLNAVIASTGGAAGISADQIKKMASGFQDITNFGDEATIASSNVLLTFTKIGGDVFPRAQKSVLDMSAALGQDLQSSSIQVGKALNDPIRGVSALQRVGITFTDSQKDMIKSLQEGGDMAGAQAVILAELETQFEGSAEAAVAADGGIQQAENAMGDLQEQIGAKMIPIMAKFKEAQLAVVTAVVDKVIPAFERFSKRVRPLLEVVGKVAGFVKDKFAEFIKTLQSGFTEDEGTKIEGIALKLREFRDVFVNQVVPAIRKAVARLKKIWEEIGPDVKKAFGTVGAIIKDVVGLIEIVIKRMVQVVGIIWARWGDDITRVVEIWGPRVVKLIGVALDIISGIIRTVTAIIKGDWSGAWDGIKQVLSAAWEGIKIIVAGGIAAAKETLRRGWDAFKALFSVDESVTAIRLDFDRLVGFLRGLPGRVGSAVAGMWSGLWTGFRGVLNQIITAWNNLEFKLPSLSAFGKTIGGQTIGTPNIGTIGGSRGTLGTSRRAASGGIRSGLTMVGEQGRELVDLAPGSRVLSNPDTERHMSRAGGGGGGGGMTVVVNVAGSVLSERDLVAVVREELIQGGLADAFSGAGAAL